MAKRNQPDDTGNTTFDPNYYPTKKPRREYVPIGLQQAMKKQRKISIPLPFQFTPNQINYNQKQEQQSSPKETTSKNETVVNSSSKNFNPFFMEDDEDDEEKLPTTTTNATSVDLKTSSSPINHNQKKVMDILPFDTLKNQIVPSLIDDITQMHNYSSAISKINQLQNPFPFLKIGGFSLPTLFLSELQLVGISMPTTGPLVSHLDALQLINEKLEISLPTTNSSNGDTTMKLYSFKDLATTQSGSSASSIKQSFAGIAHSFQDTTISRAETFTVKFIDSMLKTQRLSGLLLNNTELQNSIQSIVKNSVGNNDDDDPLLLDHLSEDLRKLHKKHSLERDEKRSHIEEEMRLLEENMNQVRNDAVSTMLSSLNNFMEQLNSIREKQAQLATSLLHSELDHTEKIKKDIYSNKNKSSHQLPLETWLYSKDVSTPFVCLLTGSPLQEEEEKSTNSIVSFKRKLFITTMTTNNTNKKKGAVLYKDFLLDIFHRRFFGFPLFGVKPAKNHFDSETAYSPQSNVLGLQKWSIVQNSCQFISRREEDSILPQTVASLHDVLTVCNDRQVSPWWQFALKFSLSTCCSFLSQFKKNPEIEKKFFDQFLQTLSVTTHDDHDISLLISKFETLCSRTSLVLDHDIPTDFVTYALKEIIYYDSGSGSVTNYKNFEQKLFSHYSVAFVKFFHTYRSLVSCFWQFFNKKSCCFQNTLHI